MTGYIPPNKPFLVMGGILAAMGGYGVFTTDWYDAYFEGLIPLAVLILGLLGMLGALTTMELDRKELRVKLFGMCLRRIAWEDVQQVGLLYQDFKKTGSTCWWSSRRTASRSCPRWTTAADGWSATAAGSSRPIRSMSSCSRDSTDRWISWYKQVRIICRGDT